MPWIAQAAGRGVTIRRAMIGLVTGALLASIASPSAHAVADEPTLVRLQSGKPVVLHVDRCIRKASEPASGTLQILTTPDGEQLAIYRPAREPTGTIDVTISTSSKPADAAKECPDARTLAIRIDTKSTPTVRSESQEKAFNVLIAVFVLAILLQLAFELLFRWRLYREFFASKAWRTPLMLIASLALVKWYDLDLMRSLLDAYNPAAAAHNASSRWFTELITAAILAGGSGTVNQLFRALGLRAPSEPLHLEPVATDDRIAYIAIRFLQLVGRRADISLEEVTPSPADTPPALFRSVARSNTWERISNVFLSRSDRLPPVGGYTLDALKTYRLLIRVDGRYFDIYGSPADPSKPQPAEYLRLAPRAVVDLQVDLRKFQ